MKQCRLCELLKNEEERLSVNLAAQKFRMIKTKEHGLRKGYSDNYF